MCDNIRLLNTTQTNRAVRLTFNVSNHFLIVINTMYVVLRKYVLKFLRNCETSASEFLENFEEMLCGVTHSSKWFMKKRTHWHYHKIICLQRVKWVIITKVRVHSWLINHAKFFQDNISNSEYQYSLEAKYPVTSKPCFSANTCIGVYVTGLILNYTILCDPHPNN